MKRNKKILLGIIGGCGVVLLSAAIFIDTHVVNHGINQGNIKDATSVQQDKDGHFTLK